MPGYITENEKWHLATDYIDDFGVGLIDGHIEVYCSIYFCWDEDKYSSVFSFLYIEDKENYIGKTYIRMDSPVYREYGPYFSLNADQRRKLYALLTEKQFYGMSGWEYCMKSMESECMLRDMEFTPWDMPDYMALPVKEEGFRSETEKLFNEELGEYDTVEVDPRYDLGDGVYIVAMPPRTMPKVGFYFKVIRVDMSDEELFFDERPILEWCRISMERPEYITGYDECMVLTDEQIDRMIEYFNSEYEYYRTKEKESRWFQLLELFDNDYTVTGTDNHIDLTMPMPDYSKLKKYRSKDGEDKI